MINVSDEFKKKLNNDQRDYLEKIDLTLKDGTELHLTNADIWGSSFAIEDAVGSDDTFSAIGSAIINSCSFTINNIYEYYGEYDFTDATAVAHVGLSVGSNDEYVQKGVYTVCDTSYNGSLIALKMYDNMHKFDKPYESTLVYEDGVTLWEIVDDACTACGVRLANNSQTFPNRDFVVRDRPSDKSTTYREVIAWCAAIAGCFARCNTVGELEIKWFDKTIIDQTSSDLDGGRFDKAENILSDDKRISSVISANGVTATYDQGRWHITGTPNTTQEITLTLYEDIFAAKQGTYTLRLELEGFSTISNPFRIGMNYWPDDSSIEYTVESSPYVSQLYSLTELAVVIPATSGSRSEYDGYVRVLVEKGNTGVYQSGDIADGGSFRPWDTGYVHDEGDEFVWGDAHYIGSTFSKSIGVDDVIITKVRCNIKSDAVLTEEQIRQGITSSDGVISYSKGTDGYEILIENNPFITVDGIKFVVDFLADRLNGLCFRKANVSHISDPTIEAGDVAFVFDNKGNRYPILITRTNFKVGGSQETVCGASSPLRNSASRFAETVKSYVEVRKKLVEQKTAFEQAQNELADRIENAKGMYYTEVTDTQSGAVKRYLHDKEDLSKSDIQMLFSSEGITVTPDGGDHWYGLTVDGTFVANQLYSVGINADYINTGALVAKDSNQKETFYVNTTTGVVRISASKFSVKVGETETSINDYASNIANTAASNAITTSKNYTDSKAGDLADEIGALQRQLDNQITIYYDTYVPTITNAPADDWVADGKEAEHEGEVFCNTSTGYSYRWLKTNNVWGWTQIADTGTAQAIAAARDASTLAAQKKRIFIEEPIPPYDVGDLWVQGSCGEIMVCSVARAYGSSYVSTDWVLASKYTDGRSVIDFTIGRGNLLKDTATYNTNWESLWESRPITVFALGNDKPVSLLENGFECSGERYVFLQNEIPLIATNTYTISGYYRLSPNTTKTVANGQLVTERYTTRNDVRVYDEVFDLSYSIQTRTTEWTYFSRTFTVSAGEFDSVELRISSTRNEIQFCGLKLEKGDEASSWTYTSDEVNAEIEKAVDALEDTLKQQIDGKVQTWVSASDPSTNWTAEQKEINVGDLWYYTGESIQNSYQNNCVYQYEKDSQTGTYRWSANPYSTSSDLFDAIDGKTTIYYGKPTGTGAIVPPDYSPEEGDYLVDSTDGKTYRWDSDNEEWVNVTDYMAAAQNTLSTWVNGQYASDLSGLQQLVADSKITTWYRDTDPSEDPTVWDNTENHVGDIWYCNATTGDYAERTWRWNGSNWSEMTSTPPQEVFSQINGKAHIYIGTDEPADMAEGDLWFRSADDPILTCDENGEWVEYNKYTDDTVANAVGDEVRRVERELSAEIKSLGDSVEISITETNENLEEIKTHYRFDETGETIGKTGSPKTIKLANDGIGMQVNGETVTKWNQDEMYTPTKVRVPVGGSLQLGDFIFQPRSSGNISLLFVGGD